MKNTVIDIKNLSKKYHLGVISSGTLYKDFSQFLSRITGRADPNSLITDNELSLSNSIDQIWAIKDINIQIDKGEIVGIIGKNGAGKSTLLKILSKITSPTNGTIKLKGRVASLLEVGTGFHPELTGLENIYLNGSILGMKKKEIKSQLENIIDFSGIKKYINTPIKRYSTGMKVRLGFAVAAHLDCDILFVDEVLAVGDAQFQEKALSKMNDLSKSKQKTILFVSHNLNAIQSLTDTCIFMDKGKILDFGNTNTIISKYIKELGFSNKVNSNQFEWNNNEVKKDDKKIIIRKMCLKDKVGNKTNNFKTDESITIKINLKVTKFIKGSRCILELLDRFYNIIFTAPYYLKLNSEIDYPFEIELYCTIPEDLLNQGIYYLRFSIGVPGKGKLINDKIYFRINTFHSKSIGETIETNWPGQIFPKLEWRSNL